MAKMAQSPLNGNIHNLWTLWMRPASSHEQTMAETNTYRQNPGNLRPSTAIGDALRGSTDLQECHMVPSCKSGLFLYPQWFGTQRVDLVIQCSTEMISDGLDRLMLAQR